MVLPVNPEHLKAVQAVSHHIKGKITIDHGAPSVLVVLSTENEEAKLLLPNLVAQLGDALAVQLTTYFAIDGEIVNKNRPGPPEPDGEK